MPSFIFANIGFLISTPGCSEPGSLTDIRFAENTSHIDIHHINNPIEEKIEYEMIDEEELDQVEDIEVKVDNRRKVQKQDSRISVTSGEYEEILSESEFDYEYKSLVDTPPPLPPRKSNPKSSPK